LLHLFGILLILFTNSDEIDEFLGSKPLNVVYFSADNCSACKAIKPKVEELSKEFPQLGMGEVNLSDNIEPSTRFNVFVVPAVLVFAEGKETIRMARNFSVHELKEKIERYYSFLN
jgi:thiol-disulfide isomerase/thioredoxin